ncbi:hypothetical protein BBP40_010548 [Aspergillus hancockii]|nr:hypothetical protein BBP40_010548 [Aspergillus hancockii]
MQSRSRWHSTFILTWLLTAETAHSAPTRAPEATSFKTQYPPSARNARLLIPETQGFYPTSLEREGHQLQKPTPNPSDIPFGLSDLFNDLKDPGSFLNLIIPGIAPSKPDTHPTITAATSVPSTIVPLSTTAPSLPSYTSASETISASHEVTFTSTTASSTSIVIPNSPSSNSADTALTHSAQASHSSGSSESISSTLTSTPVSQESQASSSAPTMNNGQNVFLPVPTGPVPQTIKSRNDHPLPRNSIVDNTVPIETNKFYAGLFLSNQNNATFTHPYSMAWAKGTGNAGSWGMAISHIEANMLALGPTNAKIPGNPVSYYINPIGIQSIILSATELGTGTILTTENPLPFSANAVLQPQEGSSQRITFPVVQGMAFVTAVYSNLQPVIQSSVFFKEVVSAGSPRPGIYKYTVSLADGTEWLLYLTPRDGEDPDLYLESNMNLRGRTGWSGTVQVAKNPAGTLGEKLFDNSSGIYAVQGEVVGAVSGPTGTYSLKWNVDGKDKGSYPLMMYALPHHIESFDNDTRNRVANITLRTTTKGDAVAVIGESWSMIEPDLPIDMGFTPWSVSSGSVNSISPAAQKVILDVAPTELRQDVNNQSNLNSMYFSGKALSKFATLVYTVDKLGGNPGLAASTLNELKTAFSRFVDNRQQFPLVYDNVWKGVVSSASYDGGDSGADFGNTFYNDHHFHYGYFIHAAAIIGSLDPSWIQDNKDWVNMLVRDAGNAATEDPLFPFSRGFDWFHGHSWAKGLFESFDGKDEESTSEDAMFAYALKMWGQTTGDASMEARGNLMLGILRRSLHNYFLMETDNKNQPPQFVPNKVTGILFENKVDHTTYFGANLEYVHGIHMLPLIPASPYVRSQKFVMEEWNALFASDAASPAESVQGGWKGVLYANLALIDPVAAWNFFAQPNFDYSWIDGGATRTWYLALAAGYKDSVVHRVCSTLSLGAYNDLA